MPTRRGWRLAAAAALFLVLGRMLGVVELVIAAAAGAALLAAGVVYVRATPVGVEADRALRPPRRHAGATGDVEITVRNTASRTSPTLQVHDPFTGPSEAGRRWARFRVAPLRPEQVVTATYELPGEERGVYELGPLTVHLEDPFGLAARSVAEAAVVATIVYPRIEALSPFSPGPSGPRLQARQVASASPTDAELFTVREYHMGDDLRRVHWRATAKRDELMIRHDDVPEPNAATVVLDLRDGVHTPASLETAVSVAASVVHTARRLRWQVRLVTTGGADSGLAIGQVHVEAILEGLALARTHRSEPAAVLRVPEGGTGIDAMVVVVTAASSPENRSLAAGSFPAAFAPGGGGRNGAVVVVVAGEPATPAVARVPVAVRLVRVGDDQPLAPAWAAAMGGIPPRRVEASRS